VIDPQLKIVRVRVPSLDLRQPWDVFGGLALGATVVLVGWMVLRHPLTALPAWLRRQPGLRAVFAERESFVQI
jgi:hypothetical protein